MAEGTGLGDADGIGLGMAGTAGVGADGITGPGVVRGAVLGGIELGVDVGTVPEERLRQFNVLRVAAAA